MTVECQASESKDLQTVLARMPWLHTVIYYGPQAGETYHDPTAQQGSLWLQLHSLSCEQDFNGLDSYYDEMEYEDYEGYDDYDFNNDGEIMYEAY